MKPGYKQTDVGVIPEDWCIVSLDNLSSFVTSGSRGWARYYSNGGALFVRSQNVRDGRLDLVDKQHVTPPKGSEGNRTQLKLSDLLITITGNSVGNVALVDEDLGEAYISQHVGLVRLSDSRIGRYICRYLSPWSPGNLQIEGSQSGQSKPGLTLGNLRDFQIALPPTKAEQEAIAEALSDADALIESLEQLIAKKRQIKQGTMQDLLTGKKRLPGFSGEWEEARLKTLASLINGRAYSLFEWETSGTPVIRLQNLTGRGEAFYYSNLTLPEKQYCEDGDLLFMWSATFGPVIWRGPRAIYHYHIWKIQCRPQELDKQFLFHYLSEVTEKLKGSSSSGGTMLHLTKSGMEAMKISVPSFNEQVEIGAILSDIDDEIAALEAKLSKARMLKQGMMQELLTGKTRLV